MRTFIDSAMGGVVLGCSLKCCYSFFALKPDRFIEAPNLTPDYFLCRSPFDRAIDLYMDKVKSKVAQEGPIQVCQKVIQDLLGYSTQQEVFGVSFKRFCEILPMAVLMEEHFNCQSVGFLSHRRAYTKIVHIETGLQNLGEKLNIDFSVKVNATHHYHWTHAYDADSLYTVKECYKQDFVLFGY